MPLYKYICPNCKGGNVELRDIPDVYDDVKCKECGEIFDGKLHKIVEGGMTILYEQGSQKGKMNNQY